MHPALKDVIKKSLEAAIKEQNRNKFADYDEMAGYMAERVEKFIEEQDLVKA